MDDEAPEWPEVTDEHRALLCRGTGRWVVECWDDGDDDWHVTLWRGITMERAIREAKRLHDHHEGNVLFRLRDVDTDDEILAAIL